MNRWLKGSIVVAGAVILSTVAINASDVLRGIEGSLSGLAIESAGPCGAGAILAQFGSHALCVDVFEASPSESCPLESPQNELDTARNIADSSCQPTSQADVLPWRFVTFTQAQQLCARAGKRLPDNDEWYKLASGLTDIEQCVIDTGGNTPNPTGTADCYTPMQVADMVGNVWEWIDAEVVEGEYANRTLPDSGYVAGVDTDGVASETSTDPQAEYGADYVNTNLSGIRGMIRGGYYGSGDDAGLFALNAAVPLDIKTTAIGFRCVKDL